MKPKQKRKLQSMKEERKARRNKNRASNMAYFDAHCTYAYETRNDGTVMLFRVPGKPIVDYFPTTNKWNVVSTDKRETKTGNAQSFLEWFEKQELPAQQQIGSVTNYYTDWAEVKTAAMATGKTIVPINQGWMLK